MEKVNVLTCDGGGIRGYWSLLALKALMDHVAEFEESDQVVELEDGSGQRLDGRTRPNGGIPFERHALPTPKRYLPCDYFDFVGGTSTGGYPHSHHVGPS
ncbi:hypothetical protein LTR62_006264 [Meristemomyces frigidus]|uniref:PNPLA domain-containing protein n=1 Tax=Meristemomyces frigidus TaxID=1508187 RepID=A0AAN7TDQ7_9PEZI|nr:hypothetical protein LTR62_006264 [Meristemomyces frigidus]